MQTIKHHTINNRLNQILEFLCISLVITFLSCAGSSQQIKTNEWPTHVIGSLSFQYPEKFEEIDASPSKEDANFLNKTRFFMTSGDNQIAMCAIYDYKMAPPSIEEGQKSGLNGGLNNIGATNIKYFDAVTTSNTFGTKFNYKINSKTFVGYAFTYKNNRHFESLFFIPHKKGYSDEHFEKIISNITVIGNETVNKKLTATTVWKTQVIQDVSFQYPPNFEEIKGMASESLASSTTRAQFFVHSGKEQMVMYSIIDFKTAINPASDFLLGNVEGFLHDIATDIRYYDNVSTENTYGTKVIYKINDKPYVGYAFIYAKGKHVESLLFLPHVKEYSDEDLERIKAGIKVTVKK